MLVPTAPPPTTTASAVRGCSDKSVSPPSDVKAVANDHCYILLYVTYHPERRVRRRLLQERTMADFRVVIPDDYPPMFENLENPDLAPLKGRAEVILESTKWEDREDFFSRIASANAVINVRGYSKFDAEALAHAPDLKLIS